MLLALFPLPRPPNSDCANSASARRMGRRGVAPPAPAGRPGRGRPARRELRPHLRGQSACSDALHRAVVVIADPHADGEIAGQPDEGASRWSWVVPVLPNAGTDRRAAAPRCRGRQPTTAGRALRRVRRVGLADGRAARHRPAHAAGRAVRRPRYRPRATRMPPSFPAGSFPTRRARGRLNPQVHWRCPGREPRALTAGADLIGEAHGGDVARLRESFAQVTDPCTCRHGSAASNHRS